MPIPIAVYVFGGAAWTAVAVYYKRDAITGKLEEIAENEAREAVAAGADLIEDVAAAIGNVSLAFVRGLGAAVVDGVDFAFDAIRDKLRGKEPDVIAGFTVGAIAILTGVFLYHSVKNAKDAL